MNHRLMLVALVAFLATVPLMAQEGSLADALPPETLLYVETPDAAALVDHLGQGPIGRILAEPGFEALAEVLRGALAEPLEEADGALGEILGTDLAGVLSLFRGHCALALIDVPDRGEPVLALALDAGDRADLLRSITDHLAARFETAEREGRELSMIELYGRPENVRLVGSRLIVSNDPRVRDAAAGGGGDLPSLADSPAFGRALARVAPDGRDLLAYLRVDRFLERADDEMGDEERRVVEGLGLRGIESVAAAVDLETLAVRAFVSTIGEPVGLVALLDQASVEPGHLPVDAVPSAAFDTGVGRLDLAGSWRQALAIFDAIDERNAAEARQAIEGFEKEAGASIEGLLGRIGPAFVSYGIQPELGGMFADTFFVVAVDDPEAFVGELGRLVEASGRMRLHSFETGGRTIHSLSPAGERLLDLGSEIDEVATALGMLEMIGLPSCFTFEGRTLVAASSGQALQRRFLAVDRPTRPLRVDGTFSYRLTVDQRRAVGSLYNTFLPFAKMGYPFLRAQAGLDDAEFHPNMLPPAEAFAGHLGQGRLEFRSVEGGLLVESEAFLVPTGSFSVPTVGVLAAMLLPALASVKEKANQSRCMSNLKQIGLGVWLYMDSNGDTFPPLEKRKLFETLFADGFLEDPAVYICPSSDDAAGFEGQGLVGCSYETWAKGRITSAVIARSGSRIPIAWDREAYHHDDARCVLFADGHVERVDEDWFEELLDDAAEEHGLER